MSSQSTDRLIGLDLLRSLAMLMIVIWHFYFHAVGSNQFPNSSLGTVNYLLSEFLVVCCSACVNVFVLISSYFLVEKPFNASRILRLWLQVMFYSVGISLLFYFLTPGTLTWKDILRGFFPVSNYIYWFFSIYFGLALLAPFLSKTAVALSQKEYRLFLLVLIILCCTFTLIFPLGNTMGGAKGYSLLWFIALFFWGGYFRRFKKPGPEYCLGVYFGLALLVTLFCVGKSVLRIRSGAPGPVIELPAYNGFAFLLSIPLFLYFKDKSFRKTALVKAATSLAPYTFGVYLISEHRSIREYLWNGPFPWASYLGQSWILPLMLGVSIVIFILCVGIDWLRTLLFNALGIHAGCDKLTQWVSHKINRIHQ